VCNFLVPDEKMSAFKFFCDVSDDSDPNSRSVTKNFGKQVDGADGKLAKDAHCLSNELYVEKVKRR
jgi:hypothetical protein